VVYEHQISSLYRLKAKGINPRLIIDCGCAVGDWSEVARGIFPDPPIYAFDVISYEGTAVKLPKINNLYFNVSALGAKDGEKRTFFLNKNVPLQASYHKDLCVTNEEELVVYTRTLNDWFRTYTSPELPILMKLDTQGSELEILEGASNLLPQTEVIILEVSTISGNVGGPEFRDVVEYLWAKGFVVYDVIPSGVRGEIVAQMDVIFVPKNHPIRDVFKVVK